MSQNPYDMQYTITPWMKRNENGWCAIDQDTHDLIDRDINFKKLNDRMKASGIQDYTYCKNWFRPMQFRDDEKEAERHRQFLRECRSQMELDDFNAKLKLPRYDMVPNAGEWPITRSRHVILFAKKKGRQLRALFSA